MSIAALICYRASVLLKGNIPEILAISPLGIPDVRDKAEYYGQASEP